MNNENQTTNEGWLRTLTPGSTVWWSDPDAGISSGSYTVTDILAEDGEIFPDTIFCLKNETGSSAEVYASELIPHELVTVRLALDVTYNLLGENISRLLAYLNNIARFVGNHQLLPEDTQAEVETYVAKITVQPEPLTEGQLADFMLHRIENGDLGLEDIPTRLTRYGLMEPHEFIEEMRERMGLSLPD